MKQVNPSLRPTRRRFLTDMAAGTAVAGVSDIAFLSRLHAVPSAEAKVSPEAVQLLPEIEPTVRLIEDTPRARLMEVVAERIKAGMSYRELLAGLLLAGVRNVEPRPSVGFKFHAVLVVNSAHLASLSSPATERWLPILWALDNFKSAQARDVREGNWTMPQVNQKQVPSATQAKRAFRQAMNRWDEEAADAAVTGLVRGHGANQVFELFAEYAARDFRSIGHKAIFLANAWRTLQTIGWRHAEPVMRSLAYALLNHVGEPNPAENDLSPDRAWRRNQALAGEIRAEWKHGQPSDEAVRELLAVLHAGNEEQVCKLIVAQLNRGVSPQSIFDALFLGAGELLMRQNGIVALHALTTTNALRFIYNTSGSDTTRRLVLLQNAAFLCSFREAMRGRGQVLERTHGQLDLPPDAVGDHALGSIFQSVDRNRLAAAQKTLAYLNNGQSPQALIAEARRLVFLKGNDSHDYKFSSAVLEDYYQVSPAWRNRYLATSLFKLHGTGERTNPLVDRIGNAFQA